MPSCKKIGAFSTFLGKSIVAYALAFAFNYVMIDAIFRFGGNVIIKPLACGGYISWLTAIFLVGALFGSVLVIWSVVFGGGVFYDAAARIAKAEWRKFKSVSENNDTDAAKEIPKITIA